MELVNQLIVFKDFLRVGVSGNDVVCPGLPDIGELLPVHLPAGESLRLEPVAGGIDSCRGIEAAVKAADIEKRRAVRIHDSCGTVTVDVLREPGEENVIFRCPEILHVPAAAENHGEADPKRDQKGCRGTDNFRWSGRNEVCSDSIEENTGSCHSGHGEYGERECIVRKMGAADVDKKEREAEHQDGSDALRKRCAAAKQHPDKPCQEKEKVLEIIMDEPV